MDVRAIQPVVTVTCRAMIRNQTWREEAEQEVWLKLVDRNTKGLPITAALVVVITRNVCRDYLRKTIRRESDAGRIYKDGSFLPCTALMIDVKDWVAGQANGASEVLSDVLWGDRPWRDFNELSARTGVSKATCSRALNSLQEYLTSYATC